MKHKDLLIAIASSMNQSEETVEKLMDATVEILKTQLIEGNTIGLQGFGSFELRRKEERLSVHPVTKIRTLIPPKLVVNFKQSSTLKVKLKEIPRHE
ncbi:MAG: HU family DNA-binding protein [Paludibacter sp.]|nr:HU family DNA-binding protein [Paludibacter sp.]